VDTLGQLLEQQLSALFAEVVGEPVDPVVHRSQHADFQADGALGLAKRLGRSPRDIAVSVLDGLDRQGPGPIASAEVSGPGFVNLTVSDETMGSLLGSLKDDPRLGVAVTDHPELVVVDYSHPNAAKEMHVGHLRSTINGDAVDRLLEWKGHRVLRQNHIGDWGTPFGMLIEHMLDIGETETAHELEQGDLNRFYQEARAKFDRDDTFKDRSRRRVTLLQSGDEATLRLWQELVDDSKRYFLTVYARLDVLLTEDDFRGESQYNDQLLSVVEELDRLGLLVLNDGAKCVFPPGFSNRHGDPLPLIVQKSDGGFGYAATDLAAIRHRARDLGADRLLYVVGLPQRQHLEMVFEVARRAGWLRPPARAEHLAFGSVLGPDGKVLRTRAGESVKLLDLLDEAVARAAARVAEKNPDLDAEERDLVAHLVGIGAVKYADVSTDRMKDYVFDLDRMLAFEGNTAPYLQYAHARIRSIFRRAEVEPDRGATPVLVAEPAERALALDVLEFGDVIAELEQSLEFHRLANYLHRLASTFTTFYERCPVLRAEEPVRASRLALCDLTARTLALGLGLLGIVAPDRM
jgi:arginyl-tRNA synthetase